MKILTILLTVILALTFWGCDKRVNMQDATFEEKLEATQEVIDGFPLKEAPFEMRVELLKEDGTDELDQMSEYHLSVYQQSIGHDLRDLEIMEDDLGKLKIWKVARVDFGDGTQFLATVEAFSDDRPKLFMITGVQDGMIGLQITALTSLAQKGLCAILPGKEVQTSNNGSYWTMKWDSKKSVFEDVE